MKSTDHRLRRQINHIHYRAVACSEKRGGGGGGHKVISQHVITKNIFNLSYMYSDGIWGATDMHIRLVTAGSVSSADRVKQSHTQQL